MPFRIIRDDISRVRADAIVCSASPKPGIAGGGEAAIHNAAGPGLMRARYRFGRLEPGAAVATKAYGLPAKYVIHTVGPIWRDGQSGEIETLHRCYRNAICTAISMGCKSAAFPLISSGHFGFSKSEAMRAAIWEFQCFAEEDIELILVVYDAEAYELSSERFADVAAYIDDNYVAAHPPTRDGDESIRLNSAPYGAARAVQSREPEEDRAPRAAEPSPDAPSEPKRSIFDALRRPRGVSAPKPPHAAPEAAPDRSTFDAVRFRSTPEEPFPEREESRYESAQRLEDRAPTAPFPECREPRYESALRLEDRAPAASSLERSLEERMRDLDAGFSETLLKLIDESGCTDAEIYKRANISRKLFSKIRSSAEYRPSKPTALAFCVALHLKPQEARELIGRAGYALSHSSRFDVIVEYFLEKGKHDIIEINETLFYFDQPLLGSV